MLREMIQLGKCAKIEFYNLLLLGFQLWPLNAQTGKKKRKKDLTSQSTFQSGHHRTVSRTHALKLLEIFRGAVNDRAMTDQQRAHVQVVGHFPWNGQRQLTLRSRAQLEWKSCAVWDSVIRVFLWSAEIMNTPP